MTRQWVNSDKKLSLILFYFPFCCLIFVVTKSWCVLALLPECLSVLVKDEWKRQQDDAHNRQKRTGPVYVESVEHVSRKEWEHSSKDGTKEGVRCDGGGCKHEVGIDDVVETLQEDEEYAGADKDTRKSWHDPVDVCVITSPGEPEKTDRENNAAKHCGRKTVLWNWDTAVCLEGTNVTGFVEENDQASEKLTNDKTNIWKSAVSASDVMVSRKHNWVSREHEVKHTIDEGDIKGDEKDDWLGE